LKPMARLISALSSLVLLFLPFSIATAQSSITTTAVDRRAVNITVYNSNIGLVRETRTLALPNGRVALRFADVSAQIRPETVHLRSLTQANALSIMEQNYQYDLLNPGKLLDKYVGREITLILRRYQNSTEILEPVKAVLLSNNQGQVWQLNNQIVINPTNIAEMRFPDVPKNLVSTPTLVWDVENARTGEQTVEASYLTGGMNWKADYVLVVNAGDTRGDLQGWVTLVNQSGMGFENAQLQLVAGDLNRVREENELAGRRARDDIYSASQVKSGFQEQSFFEYHLYTLQRPTSIREQETKQLSLLESSGFDVSKEYVINGQTYYYRSYNNPGAPIKEKVGVYMQFRNSERNRLGMPLPAGTVRLYKQDERGNQQFIGEDRIDHTPKDEDVRVKVGDAFDIVAERKQTDYKVIATNVYEYAYEIKIRNHKQAAVTVIVNEPIGGDWEMVSSSYKAEKTAAFAAQFRVAVEKDGEAKLTYRVRVKY
jgi:hypothetical protein